MITSAWCKRSIGQLVCEVLSDGTVAYDAELIFTGADGPGQDDTADNALQAGGRVVTPCSCLVIRDADKTVLVDTGLGKLAAAWDQPAGHLLESLAKAGLAPGDVDLVVITHIHPETIGGLTHTSADGRAPVFPCPHHMLREEWEFWTSTQIEALPEFMGAPARLHLPALADAMFPVHPETELAPGLVIHAAGGHTPGHAVLEIHDGGQTLLWCSDTILHPLHFSHPDCHSAFDIDPAQALRTRRKILEHVVAEQAILAGFRLDGTWRVERYRIAYRGVPA